MNAFDSPPRRSRAKQTSIGGLILAGAATLYAIAQPKLNERYGWDLPGLSGANPPAAGTGAPAQVNPTRAAPAPVAPATAAPAPAAPAPAAPAPAPGPRTPLPAPQEARPNAARPDGVALDGDAKRNTQSPLRPVATAKNASPSRDFSSRESPQRESQPREASSREANVLESRDPRGSRDSSGGRLYGMLADQGNERYLSPAGLLYTRGSQEGHRLKHLERHIEDDPSRPGSHGVFDGGMEGALAAIDLAYTRAKSGVKTTVEEEDGRTIYTVDLGKRIGYIGGSEGRRRKNPMARRLRLVVDQNRVITAYPM